MPKAHVSVDLETSQSHCSFPRISYPFRNTSGRGTRLGRGAWCSSERKGSRIISYGSRASEGVTRGSLFIVPPTGGWTPRGIARRSHTPPCGRVSPRGWTRASGREETTEPGDARCAQTARARGQMCTAALLTVFRQVVLALFSLHLLAPAFHAVSLRLQKLQKPVAVPVAH